MSGVSVTNLAVVRDSQHLTNICFTFLYTNIMVYEQAREGATGQVKQVKGELGRGWGGYNVQNIL